MFFYKEESVFKFLVFLDKGFYMIICTVYIFLGLAFTSTIIEIVRRQMVENLRRMQELRAQIKAQVKLAETLKKLSDNAGMKLVKCSHVFYFLLLQQLKILISVSIFPKISNS